MTHFALALIAIFIILIFAKWGLNFILDAFEANAGCGCLAMIVVAIGGVIILAIAC